MSSLSTWEKSWVALFATTPSNQKLKPQPNLIIHGISKWYEGGISHNHCWSSHGLYVRLDWQLGWANVEAQLIINDIWNIVFIPLLVFVAPQYLGRIAVEWVAEVGVAKWNLQPPLVSYTWQHEHNVRIQQWPNLSFRCTLSVNCPLLNECSKSIAYRSWNSTLFHCGDDLMWNYGDSGFHCNV